MDELIKTISNVGFPIAISAYLLIRIENKLETLSSSIAQLARAVEFLKSNG
ncbi:YvrJ family protein [Candidatus Formimonas warabiya]|uniref:YvrJ family protein n=1 Tax=Formimonas warabiya TaxID=1761012 RepID=A0A3G1KQ12_FORW1|nr:YvrJ family protein [Candidatus Formimonas warabiya]ATW24516.1 YvrJ family protein [Candidatus Formimonas warabiya]